MKTYQQAFVRLLKYLLAILLYFGINSGIVSAQNELYRTSTGRLFIKADLNDTAINLNSDELVIMLDYETGDIILKQEISSLIADNDTIQSKLSELKDIYLKFEGKLGLDYINTTDHAPLDFQVEGIMYPQNVHVIGTGHLEHIAQKTSSACLLSLTFILEPEVVFPENQFPELHKNIYVKVVQSLLARVTD